MTRKRPKEAKETVSQEKGLWDQVKTTVDPLDSKQRALYSQALADYLDGPIPAAVKRAIQPSHAPALEHPTGKQNTTPLPTQRAKARSKTSTPPLVELDRKARSRIARGRTPIDARVDLHGLRQHEAQDALRHFIWRSYESGHRTVLVITGKGSRSVDPHPAAPPWAVGSGILRKAVPGWLSSPDLRAAVLSFEPASPNHGGEGALYVRLRARRV